MTLQRNKSIEKNSLDLEMIRKNKVSSFGRKPQKEIAYEYDLWKLRRVRGCVYTEDTPNYII